MTRTCLVDFEAMADFFATRNGISIGYAGILYSKRVVRQSLVNKYTEGIQFLPVCLPPSHISGLSALGEFSF